MANIIIKSNERKEQTKAVLKSYRVLGTASANQKEAAEHIAVRSQEAYKQLQKMGGKL